MTHPTSPFPEPAPWTVSFLGQGQDGKTGENQVVKASDPIEAIRIAYNQRKTTGKIVGIHCVEGDQT